MLLQKGLFVLLEIFSKDQFLKKDMLMGLIFYAQKQNNTIIEYTLLLN